MLLRKILLLGLAFLLLGLFIEISDDMQERDFDSFDSKIITQVAKARVDALNGPAIDITALGSSTLITLFLIVALALLWLKREQFAAVYLLIGSIGAGLGTRFMKTVFARPRPTEVEPLIHASGFSYPSGHSFGAASFYLLLMFLAWRYYRKLWQRVMIATFALIIISLVCFSRVYLGVHYPMDVLAGALLGAAWVCLLTVAIFGQGWRSEIWKRTHKNEEAEFSTEP